MLASMARCPRCQPFPTPTLPCLPLPALPCTRQRFEVVFRNDLDFPINLHFDGALLAEHAQQEGAQVAPGSNFTYTYTIPERCGGGGGGVCMCVCVGRVGGGGGLLLGCVLQLACSPGLL